MSDIYHQTSAKTQPQCIFSAGWHVTEVTQYGVYHENSNPVFLTVALNEKCLLDRLYQQADTKRVGYQDFEAIVFNLRDSQF